MKRRIEADTVSPSTPAQRPGRSPARIVEEAAVSAEWPADRPGGPRATPSRPEPMRPPLLPSPAVGPPAAPRAALGPGLVARRGNLAPEFSSDEGGEAGRASLRLDHLLPDEKGRITTCDIAPGELGEAAERLQRLYECGFRKLWLILIDSGYQARQAGYHQFVAAAGRAHTPCHTSGAADPADATLPASDGGGQALSSFLRALETWAWTKPLTLMVFVSQSAQEVVRLTEAGRLPRSHVVTGHSSNTGTAVQQLAATAHPGGHLTILGDRPDTERRGRTRPAHGPGVAAARPSPLPRACLT